MNEFYHTLSNIFGLDLRQVNFWQMAIRAAFIYISSLIIVRFADKRLLGKSTAFDIILGIVIGSVFSRAINGNAPLFLTIFAGITLVGLHWLFAFISLYNKKFGKLVKGSTSKIIDKFTPDPEKMRKGHVTEDDLKEQLRLGTKQASLEGIKEAYIERSGEISFIKEKNEPRILDIKVENGVQTVRIKLE